MTHSRGSSALGLGVAHSSGGHSTALGLATASSKGTSSALGLGLSQSYKPHHYYDDFEEDNEYDWITNNY